MHEISRCHLLLRGLLSGPLIGLVASSLHLQGSCMDFLLTCKALRYKTVFLAALPLDAVHALGKAALLAVTWTLKAATGPARWERAYSRRSMRDASSA